MFAQRATWLRLWPMRAICRLRSRSRPPGPARSRSGSAPSPCRSSAEGDTPAAAALALPGGVLRPRDAKADGQDGAPLSHERTGQGVRGTASPVRPLLLRGGRRGVRRGAQHPLARAQCGHTV